MRGTTEAAHSLVVPKENDVFRPKNRVILMRCEAKIAKNTWGESTRGGNSGGGGGVYICFRSTIIPPGEKSNYIKLFS